MRGSRKICKIYLFRGDSLHFQTAASWRSLVVVGAHRALRKVRDGDDYAWGVMVSDSCTWCVRWFLFWVALTWID
jgi:hypothetical protein